MVTKFGTGIDLDDISREFDGQGHRSKGKVIQLKKRNFGVLAQTFCSIFDISAYNGFMCTHTCAKSRNMCASTNWLGMWEVQQHFSVFFSFAKLELFRHQTSFDGYLTLSFSCFSLNPFIHSCSWETLKSCLNPLIPADGRLIFSRHVGQGNCLFLSLYCLQVDSGRLWVPSAPASLCLNAL